ncbi:hypothetical protein MASR2M78_20700 [Treponema sp.]
MGDSNLLYQNIHTNSYFDSVTLMRLSVELGKLPGVQKVSAMMGTPANLTMLSDQGLYRQTLPEVGPADLCVCVAYSAEENLPEVVLAEKAFLEAGSTSAPSTTRSATATAVGSWKEGALALSEPRVAFISLPGPSAAVEAKRALDADFDVFLFSDNIDQDDEVILKQRARDAGRLVMGPDCGTAMIGGIRFGFANRVRAGSVGLVAASGTGAQEIASALDRAGIGISHIIGTGGHDLSGAVGGITTRQAAILLAEDQGTKRIVVISKPPDPDVAKDLTVFLAKLGKPVSILFLGMEVAKASGSLSFYRTFGDLIAHETGQVAEIPQVKHHSQGRFIRALYVGGSFAYQAADLLKVKMSVEGKPWTAMGHCVVDFGDDRFTQGRPHPMIDGSLRQQVIHEVLVDLTTGVLVCDVVLGDGSEDDPAGRIVQAVQQARKDRQGTDFPAVIVHVVGTAQDLQGYARQVGSLRDAGVLVADTSTAALESALAGIDHA